MEKKKIFEPKKVFGKTVWPELPGKKEARKVEKINYYQLVWEEDPEGVIIGCSLGKAEFIKELDCYREKDECYNIDGFFKYLAKKVRPVYRLKTTVIGF